MVTASHNPIDYNGMKLVRKDSRPVSGDTGLRETEELAHYYLNHKGTKAQRHKGTKAQRHKGTKAQSVDEGGFFQQSILDEYIQHILSYVDSSKLKPLKLGCQCRQWCSRSCD